MPLGHWQQHLVVLNSTGNFRLNRLELQAYIDVTKRRVLTCTVRSKSQCTYSGLIKSKWTMYNN